MLASKAITKHRRRRKENPLLEAKWIQPNLSNPPARQTLYLQLLPSELWLQIFYWARRQSDDSRGRTLAAEFVSGEIWPPRPEAPLEVTISQTCVYFRCLAIEERLLWTTIRLDATCRLSDIRRRIHRSTPLTLDVAIDLLYEGIPSQYPMFNAAIDLLFNQSTRWGRLRIRVNVERRALALVTRLRSCSAPKLQSLSLSVNVIDVIDITASPSTAQILLNGAPAHIFARLRGLSLKHCRPPVNSIITLHLDATQFVTVPFATFSSMISASPQLRNLSIYGDIVEPRAWSDQNIILLPNLRSLRLCSQSGVLYSSFLLGTTAPKLKHLILKGVRNDMDLEQLWSSGDGNDKTFSVKHLVFIDFNLSAFAYGNLFRIFPDITGHASLRTLHTESHLVKILLASQVDGDKSAVIPWPQLQHLQLAFNQTCNSSQIMPKLIELREGMDIPLGQVSLILSPDEIEKTPIAINFVRHMMQQLLPAYGHSFSEDNNSPYTDYDDTLFI